MNIIMLSGKARVGKTWLAKVIAEYSFNNGQIPVLLSFASAIKEAALELKGLTKENNPEEYRLFCQRFGRQKREENPDYWVDIMLDKLKDIKAQEMDDIDEGKKHWERVAIIDDARYMNEVALGRTVNAVHIFLSCGKRILEDHYAEWRKDLSEEMANLVEENDKNYEEVFEYIVVNDGTKDELIRGIADWFPIWCGLKPINKGNDDCNCEICRARRNGTTPDMDLVIEDFLDQLIKRLEGEKKDEDSE
jgi:GTPase SAR1 family protein